MTEAEADRILPGLGLASQGALAGLVAAGLAREAAQAGVTLEPVVCAGSDDGPGGPTGAVIEVVRAAGCRLPMAEAARALAPRGLDKNAVSAVVAELASRGDARLEGGTLALVPGLCVRMAASPAMDVRRRVQAAEWLEGALGPAPRCQARRADLAAEGVAVGIGPDDLALAVEDLVGRGRARVDGEGVALVADCTTADRALAAVAALPEPALRAAVAAEIAALGCRLPLSEPEAALRTLSVGAAARLGIEARPEADAALRARVLRVLDNPGPAYQVEADDLVLRHCTP